VAILTREPDKEALIAVAPSGLWTYSKLINQCRKKSWLFITQKL